MNPEIKDLVEKLIPIIYTLSGAIAGIAGTIVITMINNKSKEKKQLRELAFKAGIENWKEASAIAQKKGGAIFPLDMFIINMKLLSDNLSEEKLEKETIKTMLKKNWEINKEMHDFYLELDKPKTVLVSEKGVPK